MNLFNTKESPARASLKALETYTEAYGRARTDAERSLILALIAHTKGEIARLINPPGGRI